MVAAGENVSQIVLINRTRRIGGLCGSSKRRNVEFCIILLIVARNAPVAGPLLCRSSEEQLDVAIDL